MVVAELRSLDIPFWDDNMLNKVIMSCIKYLIISFVNLLYGMK